jgi:hypothetical protein
MTAMSRRFYERLAKEYKQATPAMGAESPEYAIWLHMVFLTANTINELAGTFDKPRFLKACGIDPPGI